MSRRKATTEMAYSLGINKKDINSMKISIKYKVNTLVQFKVKEIYSDNQVLLSRKQVGEEALEWAKNVLEPGMIVKGIVRNIRKFGAFVEIGGGVVGLAHIEDLSVARIKSP